MMREKVGWSSQVERNFTGSRQFSPHQARPSQRLRETVTTASKNAESNVDRDSLLSTPQWLIWSQWTVTSGRSVRAVKKLRTKRRQRQGRDTKEKPGAATAARRMTGREDETGKTSYYSMGV